MCISAKSTAQTPRWWFSCPFRRGSIFQRILPFHKTQEAIYISTRYPRHFMPLWSMRKCCNVRGTYVKPVSLPKSFNHGMLVRHHHQAKETQLSQVMMMNLTIFRLQCGSARIKRSKKWQNAWNRRNSTMVGNKWFLN